MTHDDFAFEPAPGLPAPLPSGESLLWQGTPAWRALAVRAYHVRKVALYFLALVAWRVSVGLTHSDPPRDVLVSCALLVALGGIAVAVLTALAYFTSRSTIYSITTRRVLLRHGIAVPLTMNIPLRMVDAAALKQFSNGIGDIALTVPKNHRVGYLITWPHLRPGHITRPQPSFRTIPDAARAADILGRALAVEASSSNPLGVAAATRSADSWTPPLGADAKPGGPRSMSPRPAAVA